jgi:hypothetical protein
VLWDVIAAQRLGRLPVDGYPGFDKHGYDSLDFVKTSFSRYAALDIDNEVGTFVSFQVCQHLPPIVFRPVPTINKLLKEATNMELHKSVHGNSALRGGGGGKNGSWVGLRRESISATSEWALAPLFSCVPCGVLLDVIGELLKETQLVVLSERLGMLSSAVLG